jgi:hypothetical protein
MAWRSERSSCMGLYFMVEMATDSATSLLRRSTILFECIDVRNGYIALVAEPSFRESEVIVWAGE